MSTAKDYLCGGELVVPPIIEAEMRLMTCACIYGEKRSVQARVDLHRAALAFALLCEVDRSEVKP